MRRVTKLLSSSVFKRGDAAKPADGCGGTLRLTTACHYFERGANTEAARFLGIAKPSGHQSRRPRRKMRDRGWASTSRTLY
jgi:hypothetical protein